MTVGLRCNIISQAMIELSRRLLHLLPQKIKRREFLPSRLIAIKIDIVSDGVCRPKGVNASGGERLLHGDLIEKVLRVIEKFARLFADHRIIQYRRVTAAQFPYMKEWRPVDVIPKIDNRWANRAHAREFRPRWFVSTPVNACLVRSCFLQR